MPSTMSDWIVYAVLAYISFPIWVYIVVKFATVAFYEGKQRAKETALEKKEIR